MPREIYSLKILGYCLTRVSSQLASKLVVYMNTKIDRITMILGIIIKKLSRIGNPKLMNLCKFTTNSA